MFGLTVEQFEEIKLNRDFILNNIESNPLNLALKGVSSTICTQIKYLTKCKSKIPNYYSVGAVIPPLSYEQCSSSLSVISRGYNGNTCLDMTCGLGVDSFALSQNFNSVMSIERDVLLSEIAKYNFSLLGADNIEVKCDDSASFVKNYVGEVFDIVFVDPARRNQEDKVFSFEQSSPNILELMPILKRIAKRIVIKSSPMFDNNEAFDVFGDNVSLKTVSVSGECKELIIDISDDNKKQETITVIDNKSNIADVVFDDFSNVVSQGTCSDVFKMSYVHIADVGLVKSRRVVDFFNRYLSNTAWVGNSMAAVSDSKIDSPVVRTLKIIECFEYKPKNILQYLKINKIKSATIIIKQFPYDIAKIRKSLKLTNGSGCTIVVMTINHIDYVLFVE